jgi:hypothetical protein
MAITMTTTMCNYRVCNYMKPFHTLMHLPIANRCDISSQGSTTTLRVGAHVSHNFLGGTWEIIAIPNASSVQIRDVSTQETRFADNNEVYLV